MTTNVAFVVIFWSFYETKTEHDNEHASSLFFVFFLTLQKTMMSLPTYRCFLQFKEKKNKYKKLEKDDELSSFTTQEKNLDVGFSWVAENNDRPSNLSLSHFEPWLNDKYLNHINKIVIGALIMFSKNVKIPKETVNGAIIIITSIIYGSQNNVITIQVQINNFTKMILKKIPFKTNIHMMDIIIKHPFQ